MWKLYFEVGRMNLKQSSGLVMFLVGLTFVNIFINQENLGGTILAFIVALVGMAVFFPNARGEK